MDTNGSTQNDETPRTGELELTTKKGTLAWLQAQPQVEWQGVLVPACNRIPDGSSRHAGEDDGKCRVIRPDGRRCGASRTRLYGICSAHAGGGDPEAAAVLATAQRARYRERRVLLGIGPNTAANPRVLARLAAQERAEELAAALVDGPLDAKDLGAVERQRAVIAALDATFPLQQLTVEVELPSEAGNVAEMGWQDMQRLAGRLLSEGD